MIHSVDREFLTADASLRSVEDKENAAVQLSSNISSTLLNDIPSRAEDPSSYFTCNKRNQPETAANITTRQITN